MTGRMPIEGCNPIDPPCLLYDIWQTFIELNNSRGQGLSGSLAISQMDIAAYSFNRRVTFEAWELDAIRRLDRVAMSDDPMNG